MVASMEFTEAFAAANGYLGWGEPKGGIWFVGIEEATNLLGLPDDALVAEYRRLGEVSPHEHDRSWARSPVVGGRAIRQGTARILSAVSREACLRAVEDRVAWYHDHMLWAPGSSTFQANLYPLGKPRLAEWPEPFQRRFGLGPGDDAKYQRELERTRWPRLRQLRKDCRPQATICFGRASWAEFRRVFEINSSPRLLAGGKIEVYDMERTVLTHHFARSHVTSRDADMVGAVLREWCLQLP